MSISVQLELMEAVQRLADLVSFSLQNDVVQDFDVRWDHALSTVCEMLSDAIVEGLYKSEITGFCSTSHCVGLVRSRNCSKKWTA